MLYMRRSGFIAAFVVLCFTFVSADTLPAKPGNSNTPLIEKVVVDFDTMEILIFGQYLRGGVDPEISLSSLPIPLSVNDTGAADKVVAILPEWYEDGDYILVLTTESGTSSFHLDISTPNIQCNYTYTMFLNGV